MVPAWSLAPADGLRHGALDPHQQVVNGGRQANLVFQCHGHREGGNTLPTLGPPSCVLRAKRKCAVRKRKSLKRQSRDMHKEIQAEQHKGSVLIPNDAKCEVALGVTPASLRRLLIEHALVVTHLRQLR